MSPQKLEKIQVVPNVARRASHVANNDDGYHGHEHLSTMILYNTINNTKKITLFVSNKSVNIPRHHCSSHNGHASTRDPTPFETVRILKCAELQKQIKFAPY
jgi:hypothetical protein